MAQKKKYYWLKLQKDFFKRHDTRIIESMENGKDYILFYLKLLVESIDHEGHLRFSESIPYNDKMIATITNTNVDIVRSAVKIFSELGLMQTLDDETLYMNDIENMIGSETEWAEKKRIQREAKKQLEHKKEDNVQSVSNYSLNYKNTLSDKSIDTEYRVKNLELEEEYKEKNTKKEKPNYQTYNSLSNKITEAINHWNNKKNLPSCKYTIFTLPDVANVKTKFDVFRDGEILKAIDNLDICYDKIDPNYRPKAFHRFIINSLDNWLDEAEPLKNYNNPKQKKSRTLDEESYMQLLRLRENHDVDQETFDKIKNQCIKSLADKGIEFDDEYYRV